jgi:hypothetical protein
MVSKKRVSGGYYYKKHIRALENELIELAEQLEAEHVICNERGAAIIALTQPKVLADWLDLWMWADDEQG